MEPVVRWLEIRRKLVERGWIDERRENWWIERRGGGGRRPGVDENAVGDEKIRVRVL